MMEQLHDYMLEPPPPPVEFCVSCGRVAAEYEPKRMNNYCRDCALALALRIFESLSDDEKLEAAGFESLDPYGR